MTEMQRTLALAVRAGEILLQNGAEVFRVQETIRRILRAFDYEDHNVFVISNAIFATVGESGDSPCYAVRDIIVGGINLGVIEAVNDLSREIAGSGERDTAVWREKLERCANRAGYPGYYYLIAGLIGSAGFCYVLGGSVMDSVAAAVAGLFLQVQLLICQDRLNKFLLNILGGTIVTLTAWVMLWFGVGVSIDHIIIGSIIALVPGVAFVTAIRDFFNRDYLSGTIHLFDALLIGCSIAAGVGGTLLLLPEVVR